MDWLQTLTIIGVLGGFSFYMFSKIDNDIRMHCSRHDAQTQRIDQLYTMFIDLLKNKEAK